MKKLFTLFALLACFMGASAVEIVDLETDYSTITSWNGGWRSDAAAERVSIQDGCIYFQSTEATEAFYDVQFQAFGIPNFSAGDDTSYTITIKIKGTVAQDLHASFSGSNTPGTIPVTTDWQEVVLEGCQNDPSAPYFANSGQLLIQCGDYVGEWWISYVKITHEGREERPVEWLEQLTNGDAEAAWENPDTRWNDQENNFKICAWGKEKGVNMNDDGGWDPFPATIEEVDGSKVFVVHGKAADTEGDPSAWDNQFWIQAPDAKVFKVGNQFKLHFRYKASEEANTNTQFHHQNPSDYVHWQAVGDVRFTTEWQEFDGIFTVPDAATDAWSIAFNLNPENKNAIDFYFDDISLSVMKLDEGLFVASSNTKEGIEYDFDNAIEFVAEEDLVIATVGTAGKQDTWVNEVMISTVRGNDKAFKGATIKPSGSYIGEDNWGDYTEGSNAKIKLPAAGVWTIYIDVEGRQINIVKVEGEEETGPIEINPNPTEIVVNALERDNTESEQEGGTGQPWDNQFWIVANRTLDSGEATILQFKYKATNAARTSTQDHVAPGAYLHWSAIGDVNFTEEWQDFETTFTIPAEANGMQSIAFNLSEIKDANDYYIKDVVWKLEDGTESLINQTGSENFFFKVLGGDIQQFDATAINGVVAKKSANSAAIYNLAGQRVTKAYKGIIVKDGKKYLVK